MEIVAIDLGYGYVKGISSTGKSVIFPTMIGPGRERKISHLFGTNNSELNALHFKMQSEEYFAGELARESRAVTRIFERERYSHPYTKALLNATMTLLVESNQSSVHLVSGLPLDFYESQHEPFRKFLVGVQPEVEWLSGPFGGSRRKVNVDDALIIPQGAGAIFSALMERDGRPTFPELMRKGVQMALIDIGFRTTDYIVVEMGNGGSFIPKGELSGTIEEGVVELHRMIRDAFKIQTGGADLNDFYVERIIRDGMISYKGRPVNLKETVRASIASICTNIVDRLKTAWGDELDMLDALFLCGGGGSLFRQELQKSFEHPLRLVANSQFANAEGYLRLGMATLMQTNDAGYLEKRA